MKNYKLEFLNECLSDGKLTVNWYMLVKFDNGDVLKVPYSKGRGNDKDVIMSIRKYKLEKRKNKIKKLYERF